MNREAVYSALFAQWQALLTNGAGFVTVSRRLDNFANVPAILQPALYQLQATEKTTPVRGIPLKRMLSLEVFVYATSADPTLPPSSVLNPLLDAVDAILKPDPITQVQNFGIAGVQHIWIEGVTKIAEGVLENQAIAVIPVEILLV